MPLPMVNLDDRNFDQLVSEARALIPRNFPAWTDYNASDPGITLLELFAFLIEATIYQINRVPERSLERFAQLVGVARAENEAIEQTLRRALEALSARYRAITEEDFERLVIQAGTLELVFQSAAGKTLAVAPFDTNDLGFTPGTPVTVSQVGFSTTLDQAIPANVKGMTQIKVKDAAVGTTVPPGEILKVQGIARAKAVVELVDAPNVFPSDQVVKVVIVPSGPNDQPPNRELRQNVFEFLRQRCLITTRPKVVEPDKSPVKIEATVVRDLSNRRAKSTGLQQDVEQAIRNFLNPSQGGAGKTGWDFGRSVFRSELYQLIEGIAGVDHVRQLLLNQNEIVDEVPLSSPVSLIDLSDLRVTVVDQ